MPDSDASRQLSEPDPDRPSRAAIHQIVVAAVGSSVALVGLCLATFAAFELVRGGDGSMELGTYLLLIVVFLGLTIWGVRLAWKPLGLPRLDNLDLAGRLRRRERPHSRVKPPPLRDDRVMKLEIVRLAEKERGRLTVLEVAARLSLTADEAKALLDQMAAQKAAELHVTDGGVLVYVFPRSLSRSEKAARRRRKQGR